MGRRTPKIAALLFILNHETRPANRAHSKPWCYATGRHLDLHARATETALSIALKDVGRGPRHRAAFLQIVAAFARVSLPLLSRSHGSRKQKESTEPRPSNPATATATTTASAPPPGRPRLYKCPPSARLLISSLLL
jgi:hypothetical protein